MTQGDDDATIVEDGDETIAVNILEVPRPLKVDDDVIIVCPAQRFFHAQRVTGRVSHAYDRGGHVKIRLNDTLYLKRKPRRNIELLRDDEASQWVEVRTTIRLHVELGAVKGE